MLLKNFNQTAKKKGYLEVSSNHEYSAILIGK
jgi:hypothetical protein